MQAMEQQPAIWRWKKKKGKVRPLRSQSKTERIVFIVINNMTNFNTETTPKE